MSEDDFFEDEENTEEPTLADLVGSEGDDPVAQAGVAKLESKSPGGVTVKFLSSGEKDWYDHAAALYMDHFAFQNISDLQELDRILTLELMVHRWSHWLVNECDYDGEMVNLADLKKNIEDFCVDPETEVLSSRGWVSHDRLAPGDAVYTLNPETWQAEWQPVINVHRFEGQRKMLSMESRSHSSLTTENHRWLTKRWSKTASSAKVHWTTSADLDRYCRIPMSAPPAPVSTESEIPDSLVKLVGWYWTEGWSSGNSRFISQSITANPSYVEEIRSLLEETFGPGGRSQIWAEHSAKTNGVIVWRLSREAAAIMDHFAPGKVPTAHFLMCLTDQQLRDFIDTSIKADGWTCDGKYRRISQMDLESIRSFEMACAMAGIPTHTYQTSSGGTLIWLCVLLSRELISPINAAMIESVGQRRSASVEWVDYDGVVWCPETENGTWLARRNGTVYFTGNSKELRLVKKALGIDKATRDKDTGSSVAEYIANLRLRAKEFGIHRNNQAVKAITLLKEIQGKLTLYRNSNKAEREIFNATPEEILDWIESLFPEFDAIDEAFRSGQQALWIRDLTRGLD